MFNDVGRYVQLCFANVGGSMAVFYGCWWVCGCVSRMWVGLSLSFTDVGRPVALFH